MEGRDILRQFEATLSEEVLKDVMTPGKIVQKEIWFPENVENSDRQSCILLNKTSDTLLKLLVTVYKVETTETGVQEQTSTATQQTQSGDSQPTQAAGPNGDIAQNGQPCPPEPPVMCDASMQTEREQVLDGAVQTEEKQLSWALVQTDVTPLQELAVQTDIKEETEASAQTDELEMFEQETQVELGMTEVTTQTVIEQVENVAQTDIKEFKGGVSQTDISVGLRAEKLCQAAPVVQCSETQVVVAVEDGDTQTEIVLHDGTSQTEIVLHDGTSQTEIVLHDGTSQTEIVMNDNVSQTELEVSDGFMQTDVKEIEHGEMQTDPWQGLDKATQNVPEQQLQLAQTELSFWLREHKELQTTPEEPQEAVSAGSADDSANLPLSQTSTTSGVSDVADATFDQPPSLEDAEAATVPKIKDVQDDSCQTDPVTIIIGDASFLMQKIRSSAISPTKVSGSGNEIEIEVQADDGYASQSGYDRENASGAASMRGGPSPRRVPGPPRRGHPRGGVATRGGGRGARTLPPRQSRAHVAAPSPGSRPAVATGTGPSPQQQRQVAPPRPQPAGAHSSPVVIQPQQEPKERKLRPTPAAGGRGKYSCPFCSITFHESPSLYEHLQDEHHSDTVSKHSKPKGREGKTIIPRLPTPAIPGEGDPSMPVLLPAVSMEKSKAGQIRQYHVVGSSIMERSVHDEGLEEDEAEQEVVVIQQPEEPGLFEEPSEPIIRKIKKKALEELEAAETEGSGSSQKAASTPEVAVEQETEEEGDEIPTSRASSKRKRRSSAGVSPKRKKQSEEEEEEEDLEEVSPRVTRRGVEQSRHKTVDHEEDNIGRKTRGQVTVSAATPRGRGRRGRR